MIMIMVIIVMVVKMQMEVCRLLSMGSKNDDDSEIESGKKLTTTAIVVRW